MTNKIASAPVPVNRVRKSGEAKQLRLSRRVTMTDVAQVAGCSQTTVSFVLNDTPGITISAATRERVIQAARDLGYAAPSFVHLETESARGPIVNRTIGFVADHLATSPETAVAIEGARQAAWSSDNLLLIAQTMNDPKIEPRTLRTMVENGISGLIYMAIFTRQLVVPAYLYELDIPVVLLNCTSSDRAFPSVVPSEIAGGESATQYLIRRGHRRIATITGEIWIDPAKDRLRGYRRALATADIVFDPDLVIEGDWSASAGFRATRQLLELPDRPTAIFCQNDRMAIGCYEALKEQGLQIPDDISVVGYDDEEISRHLHPQLTTLILPHRAMGRWAVERLDDWPQQRPERYPIIKLECPLVERASVAQRVAG